MPIKSENKKLYPSNWKAISLRIRKDRAHWRCEFCGAVDGLPHPVTNSIVRLTVAHLDNNPANCDDSNLKALCQKCHNTLDAPMRVQHAKATRREKKHRGQLTLFDESITKRKGLP